MRIVGIRHLVSGMRLAKPIYDADGRMLLAKGVTLTDSYVHRLEQMGIAHAYIEDHRTHDIEDMAETIDPQTRQEVVGNIKRMFDEISSSNGTSPILKTGQLGREFSRMFDILYAELKQSQTFTVNISAIYASNAFLYTHCLNVGILATVMGIAKGYSENTLRKLGIGAMLHDIGKLRIDRAILDKPGSLTPQERRVIERHCEIGFDILRSQPDIPVLSAHCALQHHERYDGTGYPRRLKGNDIHEFGRLLTVPDVYDAMTSNRVYRRAMLPHEALEYLYANVGTHFDQQFVELFVQHVNLYPIGLPVQLSNGLMGVVARINPGNFQRPVVLVMEEQGNAIKPYELDLSSHLDVTVVGCDL
ncbi:MAG: HD-GYP domain-containing protein [Alicyclobacillus sp.]|nr:HD-GYP domain-containing protein [Alicyclobacillus sp.]